MTGPSSIEVWGGEAVGDKAGMLIEHEPLINEHGMQVPPTVVLASEAIRPMVERGLPTEEDFARTEPSDFTKKVWSVIDCFSDIPAIAVRSSAEGDARGSGIYESRIVSPQRENVSEALWDVTDSFDEPVAKDFRRHAQLGKEFAVMIQPLVGQLLDETYDRPFGPPLSGTAYSSTRVHSGGVLNVVAGFGGGVDRQGAERITADDLHDLKDPSFDKFVFNARWLTERRSGTIPDNDKPLTLTELVYARAQAVLEGEMRGTSDFRHPRELPINLIDTGVRGGVFRDGSIGWTEIQKHDYEYDSEQAKEVKLPSPLLIAMDSFAPEAFLEQLQSMEQRAGYPLYVEWATTVVGGNVVPWVVQIAPAEHKNLSEVEMVDFEEIYYRAHTVIGSGHKTARNIVRCMNPKDVEHLSAYNADPKNEGYVLVYSSRLTTAMASHGHNLYFADCHRAAVILEEQDAPHVSASPVEHIMGAVDLTNKFFGVIDHETMDDTINEARRDLPREKWTAPDADPGTSGLSITEGELTIVADELNDRMLLGKIS